MERVPVSPNSAPDVRACIFNSIQVQTDEMIAISVEAEANRGARSWLGVMHNSNHAQLQKSKKQREVGGMR